MAVLGILDVEGFTTKAYDAVIDRMGVEARPLGSIYLHIATATSEGIRVIEIWDDKEEFELFLEDTLFPIIREVGDAPTFEVTVTPVYNVFTPRLAELVDLSRYAEHADRS
ncbi:hypothetical protein [Nocardia aurantiaca]|uniref:ABM domain-containing protein n=1 Tax=Nocardia aurantiaca TaxID=2675850 RepID=A0A6I3L364_9NOCA|nr:hypothetical protein [Nocardia aurantiaca]MTE17483.1 hypothetical protein [Nocardia aurantiaca]